MILDGENPVDGGGVSTATLLLLPFDGGANLGNDLGTEAVRHDQQSGCDRESAFDGRGLWAEDLAVLSSPSNRGEGRCARARGATDGERA